MVKAKTAPGDPALAELVAIKRLLILALRRSGASQDEVAGALEIDQSQVSRMLASKSSGQRRRQK